MSPEAAGVFPSLFWPSTLTQVTWSSPRTNRLLLEAGASMMRVFCADPEKDPNTRPNDISILESSTSFRYNASLSYNETVQARYVQRFAASSVTGSHALKMGIQVQEGVMDT